MNLIFYEIKASFKSSIIWMLTLIGLFALMMLGAYPIYSSAMEEVTAILANFPPEFTAAFGMDLEILFSYGGFYNFSFGYIGVVGAIMATALAISVFAREKRSKCSDFLLTRPILRKHIFVKKLLACLIVIGVTNVFYVLCGIFMYQVSNDNAATIGTFILAVLGLFFTQLVFLSIGIVFSMFSKNIRSVAGAATAFGFGAFILSAISNIFEDKNLDFIAPLKYFEPNPVFVDGSYNYQLVCMAMAVVVICMGLSFVKFCKSDAHAV